MCIYIIYDNSSPCKIKRIKQSWWKQTNHQPTNQPTLRQKNGRQKAIQLISSLKTPVAFNAAANLSWETEVSAPLPGFG